jgi:hypothetical protein
VLLLTNEFPTLNLLTDLDRALLKLPGSFPLLLAIDAHLGIRFGLQPPWINLLTTIITLAHKDRIKHGMK